ncbi:PilZ domain-containing protein [Sphingomonas cannabina]|uniref:PilZ domain-containing protein n=1 Tax=Sphingomonas cannabina TaxID=2899123 RepID=UPI001F242757|nr:PilZ domain-containing protein [Sphingomonas cannabina]UIJ47102.1 PilZ domain-containing protein [Sphingomonas cannabina]
MDDHQPDGEDKRRAPRAALFLAASIEGGGTRSTVRIRNLSETGALLEGPAFPPVGTIITLTRQELQVEAKVVWIAAPRCGVEFRGRIFVLDWIAGKRGATPAGQARVDAIQTAARIGTPLAELAETSRNSEYVQEGLDERLAREVSYVRRLLEDVSSQLIRDPAILNRHAPMLQNFDIADQMLGHLARVLIAPDREAAIRAIGIAEMQSRLLGKSM